MKLFLRLSIAIMLAFPIFISGQAISPNELFKDSGEMYFSIKTDDPDIIEKLGKIVSIDKIDNKTVYAYANQQEFSDFLSLGLDWNLLTPPGKSGDLPRMLDNVNIRNIDSWDFYPTYDAYLDMMAQFAADYPDLCDTLSIGQSEEGRELMMVKISDNISVREAEPQFLYTGTMHGDELAGYVLLLRLADYLLSNYGSDPEITALVNNVEIWINPLANPDGTFNGGNNTVWGSTRYNANWVDLNRNYPDPKDGPHPDGNAWQAETQAFMQLAEDQHFVMSANLHGGAEVINYPWDTWQHLTADNDWWYFVSREYADTVHEYAPGNYLDGFNNGITNGYAWYTISGGRQDYMNYFHHCREVTMELSNTKKLSESLLDDHWEWNYRSLINYIWQCTYGVSGIVSDENTGVPVAAKVFIDGHDEDNSFVFSEAQTGFYQRMLDEGVYDITFSADGYLPQTFENVSVTKYSTTNLNVSLNSGELQAAFSASDTLINIGNTVNFQDQSTGNPISWLWVFEGGSPANSNQKNPTGISYESPGIFDVSLTIKNDGGDTSSFTKTGYIHVLNNYNMANQTISTCNALFYDSGGENGNYQDEENLEMSFLPAASGSQIHVSFMEFNVEDQSTCNYDWLKIYDGSSTNSPLLGTFCGTELPGSFTASNPDGALTFAFHSDYSVTRPGWKAEITCFQTQELELSVGWSGISLFVEPEDSSVQNMFSEVVDDLEIIIGETGIYWPSAGINTLENWIPEEGYILKMNDNNTVAVAGSVDQPVTLQLNAGWNYFPVLSAEPVSVAGVNSAIPDALVLIKEIAGTSTYWPAMGINTLLNLHPGKSYLIYLNNPANYTFE